MVWGVHRTVVPSVSGGCERRLRTEIRAIVWVWVRVRFRVKLRLRLEGGRQFGLGLGWRGGGQLSCNHARQESLLRPCLVIGLGLGVSVGVRGGLSYNHTRQGSL